MATLNSTNVQTGNTVESNDILQLYDAFTSGGGTTGAYSVSISGSLTGLATSASFAVSASRSVSSSFALTASFATNAVSASYAPDTTFPYTGSAQITGSLGVTGTFNQASSSLASNLFSHAQGIAVTASGNYSHAEGNSTKATGLASHAEGINTFATGEYSHAEGTSTIASGSYSHAEGGGSYAIGQSSHAEGYLTITKGDYSHAEGFNTVTSGSYQHVQGQYNISSSAQSAFIIGNGTSDAARSNLIFASGSQVQITGSLSITSTLTTSGSRIRNYRTLTLVNADYGSNPSPSISSDDDIVLIIDNTTSAPLSGESNLSVTNFLNSTAGRCVEIVKVKNGTGGGIVISSATMAATAMMLNNVSVSNGTQAINPSSGDSVTLMSQGLPVTGSIWGVGI
jgi:hypothetical protein